MLSLLRAALSVSAFFIISLICPSFLRLDSPEPRGYLVSSFCPTPGKSGRVVDLRYNLDFHVNFNTPAITCGDVKIKKLSPRNWSGRAYDKKRVATVTRDYWATGG